MIINHSSLIDQEKLYELGLVKGKERNNSRVILVDTWLLSFLRLDNKFT